ncbi:S-layer homology domain-containing protein [Paenibacillus sp. NFR01]|uniref:S-layer homology domain-containing protein n=1 Tax=Paenibacillus sp. NFR01 TaxID=1566279 RepID=UPI0008CC47E8|nr:S-layer homology domain-containing protein [Paenibacillus sp. NFR01]SEU28090.1 protein of unknown function [Paenibacillus sp. NFR01]
MFKKASRLGLAFLLIVGLLPVFSLQANAGAGSAFTAVRDFPIRPLADYSAGGNFSDAQGLSNGNVAVLSNTSYYDSRATSYIYTYYLKVFDGAGAPITDVNLNSLMDTYYNSFEIHMLALSSGNILLTYNKSDSSTYNVQRGSVIESAPNAYFMVLNQAGQKVVGQTQINAYSDPSLPQLTRSISATELSNGDIAFSWQRNNNISTATRVFTASGMPVSNETLLVQDNAINSYVSAGDGVYMAAYNSGGNQDQITLQIFANDGTPVTAIDMGNRGERDLLNLSTLSNGNFIFSKYNYLTGISSVYLYDKTGTSQGSFTINGSLGRGSAVFYKNGTIPGFATVSYDAASESALNNAYNNGTDWSGTQFAYLNYYDNDGSLIYTTEHPVDSGPAVLEGYDEENWVYDTEYHPSFYIYSAFGNGLVFVKSSNTDNTHYSVTGKVFANGPSQPAKQTFTVVNTSDSGVGSLRWALEQAGAVSGGEVDFDPALAGQTITLESDLTGWDDESLKATTIGDASTDGFKLTGLTDSNGQPAITVNGNGHRGILATGSGTFEMSNIRMIGFNITDAAGVYGGFGSALTVSGNHYTDVNLTNVIFASNAMIFKDQGSIVSLGSMFTPYEVNLDRVAFFNNELNGAATSSDTNQAALLFTGQTAGSISNSLFANNNTSVTTSGDTYGASLGGTFDQNINIVNNTFYNNSVSNYGEGGAYGPMGFLFAWGQDESSTSSTSSVQVYNNLVIDNKINGNTMSALHDLYYNLNILDNVAIIPGNNLLGGSPFLFVDAFKGDFRLASTETDAIDKGDNAKVIGSLDLSGAARISGGTVDLGAYEMFASAPEITPSAGIDFAAEQLTGLVPTGSYTINGAAATADSNGKLDISSGWFGTALSIVKLGNGSTTTDSADQMLAIPLRPNAPAGVSATDVTPGGGSDGSINNVTLAMEYKQAGSRDWAAVTGTSISGLAPDTYYVRYKAKEDAFASNAASVTVHESNATTPDMPEVTADDLNNVILGLDTSMEFAVDNGEYIQYNGNNAPDLSGEHTVKVRVAASGSVPAGEATVLNFTANPAIPASGLNVQASDPRGAANDGKTKVTVAPAPGQGHRLIYKNFGSIAGESPNVGDMPLGYTIVGEDGLIPAANGDQIGVAEIDASGKVVRYGTVTAVVAAEPSLPDSGNNNSGNTNTGNTNTGSTGTGDTGMVDDVIVLVNGKTENAGKATTTTIGTVKTTEIAVDPAKLQAKLDDEGIGAVVTIPVTQNSNIISGELTGQMVKNMENQLATLVLQTNQASYTLPAREINISSLAQQLGSGANLNDIKLKITIGETSATMSQVVTDAAGKGGLTLVVPPMDFTVTAVYNGKTVEVSRYNAYVERTIALPEGVDPSRITTGTVTDPDGTVRHVPTKITVKDGKYYATINSLTNSTYSVIWHPLTFADVENHWAKDAVNDMGSRLVIYGVNETTFNPNADITRAEFAAIIVRGLGLKLGDGTAHFADVASGAWYAGAVQTARAYGLINGFEDGSFRPEAKITREQAMNIIAKAMMLTGLAGKTGTADTSSVLAAFNDADSIGAWAKDSLALAAKAGLVSGRGGSKLEAKANVTRAEVAVLIERLLQKSDLI